MLCRIFALLMKRAHHLPILVLSLLLYTACSSDEVTTAEPITPTAPPIAEAILGTWETIEVETTTSSTNGVPDSSIHLLIREADWGRKYGSRPARTVFTPDGKLKRTYYNVNGAVTDVTNGIWQPRGKDSLLVIEPNTTLYYRYDLNGSLLTLTGTVDWDYDKEQDDDYRAVMRLVSRTNE